MAQAGKWLTVNAVVERLHEAGYDDSPSTVRRMVDDGQMESYRTRGRQRRISAASVDAVIRSRQQPEPDDPTTAADPAPTVEHEPESTQQG